MAKEYIEREEAIKILFRTFECYWEIPCDPHDLLVQHMVCKVRDRIKESPAADVVEVVRCKDCKHSADETDGGNYLCNRKMLGLVRPNDFCSFGERRDNNAAD